MGPLFYYELVRLARQGRSTLLRCAYALAVFAALYVAYRTRFPGYDLWQSPFSPGASLPGREMARLAEGFVYAILWAQTAAVFVLAPAYLAGAIAGERERRSLGLLFTTHLTGWDIVLGKLGAAAAHLGGILLAGLPLLALTQLWGGVDFRLLLAAFLAAALNLFAVLSVCILCSARSRTAASALAASYWAAACVFVFVGPAETPPGVYATLTGRSLVRWNRGPAPGTYLDTLASCAQANGVVAIIGLWAAVHLMRPAPLPPGGRGRPPGRFSRPDAAWDPLADEVRPRLAPRQLPPVGDRPLLWKETYHGVGEPVAPVFDRLFVTNWRTALFLIAVFAVPIVAARHLSGEELMVSAAVGYGTRLVLTLLACGWCAVLAFRSAGGVCRERDGRTLEGLLTLPVSRATLLGAKWLGPVLYSRGFGYALASVAGVGLLSGALHPLAALLLALAVAAHAAFLVSLCLWLSLVSRDTARARVAAALALLALFAGGWVVREFDARAGAAAAPPRRVLVEEAGLNPTGAWWSLAFSWDDFAAARAARDHRFADRLTAAAAGALAFGVLAGVIWLDALRRFRRLEAC